MKIRLTQGQVTEIDDVNADLVGLSWYAWRGGKTFYAVREVRKPDGSRTSEYLHQVIARRMGIVGPPDHKDRNGLNNRQDNLRADPDRLSQANRGRQSNNTSGYKGVHFRKDVGKWRAYVGAGSKRRYLGYHTDPIEAARAYDMAALEAFGEFAVLNFPATEGPPRSL